MEIKITVNPLMNYAGQKWQVIFKLNGKDYCRETVNETWTEAEVKEWAAQKCREHNLTGADIQRWN